MFKTNYLLLSLVMAMTTVIAEDNTKKPQAPKPQASKLDDGKLHGYARLHHIFDGEANGFDKNTGSTMGLGLKYGQTFNKHLAIGGEFYGVRDTGFTNENKTVALGQFLGESKTDLEIGHVSGVHFTLKALPKKTKVSWARSQFKSPLTKIQITHVPNMYEYLRVDTGVLSGNLSLSYITDMAYGSRSAADFGLIGEGTGTAGMAVSPFSESPVSLKRGEYNTISETIGGKVKSSGIAVLGYEKKIGALNINLWDFKVDNILNNLYAEADYKFGLGKGKALILSGQYLNQDMDSTVLNAANGNTYGGAFYGAQAKLKYNKLVLIAAYNKKDDEGGLYNAWGANPGYTSSIFSRNEYRDNVSAYKGTAVYNFAKNLKVMVSHANYGQSDMVTSGKLKNGTAYKLASASDAKETDIAIMYKPRKNIMLKLFNANRTSEFDGAVGAGKTFEKTQNHTRLIANYSF
ncbi:MAG: Unknown protein [uncultured Sulfurovum sp.]|uniref:Outer membrane porin, OprD family n=1 Tax=uncultured Sulfurovum sp. TaxID=269237 RepID=A0A6S6THI7_9BACT|nr:MAG: Unknown protein [uncultured Sulfurovum sp.]